MRSFLKSLVKYAGVAHWVVRGKVMLLELIGNLKLLLQILCQSCEFLTLLVESFLFVLKLPFYFINSEIFLSFSKNI